MVAPVLVSVYNRLDHLKRCIESLSKNEICKETELIVVSDAAKTKADVPIISEIREYI
jgi:GT2 family glycosyltransferase